MGYNAQSKAEEVVEIDELVHIVTFRLGQQIFAFPIDSIIQIIEMVAITPVPRADPLVEGVINLRGQMVPIIDLRKYLNFEAPSYGLHTPIILVMLKALAVGLIVDEVIDVSDVPVSRISTPSTFLPNGLSDAPILEGIARIEQGSAMLLNLERLLEPGQRVNLNEVASVLKDMPLPEQAAPVEQMIGEGSDVPLPLPAVKRTAAKSKKTSRPKKTAKKAEKST